MLIVGGTTQAGEYQQAADAIADQADARREAGAAAAAKVPEPAEPTAEQRAQMRAIVDRASEIQKQAFKHERAENQAPSGSEQVDAPSGPTYRVFVSRSMGWSTLTGLFERLGKQTDSNVRVLFRGIPKGGKIDTAIKEVARRTQDISPLPPIRIDPPEFTEAEVGSVPTITVSREGEVIARATGTTSIQGMKRRIEQGRTGDFGKIGPVFEVSEPNLIHVMKSRAARIDTDMLRKRARNSYWEDARFQRLALAKKERVRRIDPTITVKRDITTPDGTVIASAGDRLNPLRMRPFALRVVVFDATDERQIRAAADLDDGPGRVVYLSTAFDAERGWDHYREVSDELDHPVYKLTQGLRQRFELQRVPAVVTADGDEFLVREVPAERYQQTQTTETQ